MWPCTAALVLGLISLGAPASADSDLLEHCRELRRAEPAVALVRCETAASTLAVAGDANNAFEAWMHAAELASQQGESARAKAALDQAVTLLSRVGDALAAHRLARRRGLNAYREGQPVQALGYFLEALAIARGADDSRALAVSENDLGVIYRHMGNHPAALGHFEASLTLGEARGDTQLGALYANIGSLYLELGDLERADSYLQRALKEHRRNDRAQLLHHTLEELAKLAQRRGDLAGARSALDQAWTHYAEVKAPRDQLRVALQRAELEINADAIDDARAWLQQARLQAAPLNRQGALQIELISARLASDDAARASAYAALTEALEQDRGAHPDKVVQAQAQLADLAQTLGRLPEAIEHLRAHQQSASALAASRHGERFDGLRVRFDLERLETEAARQDAELAKRRFDTVLVAGLALIALAALGFHSQARQYRQRLQAAAERQALERSIAESRRAAELLRSDLRSMAWLLDQQQAAALVFDAAGNIRSATSAAATVLSETPAQLQGHTLAQALEPEFAHWAQALVESASLGQNTEGADLGQRTLERNGLSMVVRCRHLSLEEELGVLVFEPQQPRADAATDALPTASAPGAPVSPTSAHAATLEATPPEAERLAFRQLLVNLMRASLETWERAARKGRIDLAEASGIWRITIDDGRLRVRAMDRYLSLETLPDRPRWREVLRTAYFLLSEVQIGEEQRQQLERMVNEILRLTRETAH
ncbi:tetratricopeptide repeat protein [Aquimonas sp.]|uniref:tetratricopeptide repeat protein n=1 Tax=Aquimonas sp. TaxID=1872588 RepID=UPI0037C094D1